MSGIAGMVLSLGMAVDANVLIYERTKEELKAGKGTRQALSEGYVNAFSAIFDSNLTSIITGIILFNFGTGPIRGFATTLIIGILCSFFSAVFLTRLVYEHFMNKDKWMNLTFTTGISKNLMQNVHYNFIGSTNVPLRFGVPSLLSALYHSLSVVWRRVLTLPVDVTLLFSLNRRLLRKPYVNCCSRK